MVGHPLEDGRAEASVPHAVLYGDDACELAAYLFEDFIVKRFKESHVVMCHAQFTGDLRDGLPDLVSYGAETQDGHLVALMNLASLAHGDFFQRAVPVGEHASAAGIPDDECAFSRQLGGIHELPELVLVHGRSNGEVRDRAQEGEIEGTVMRRSVFSHQSCPVQAEHHRQAQDGQVVDDIVVGTLRERTVDVAERLQPVFRHASREGYGVPFGDAHIEGAARHLPHHDVHGAARGHGGGYPHDVRILPCEFQEGLSEHILKSWRLVRAILHDALAGLRVELARGMPQGGLLFGGLVALALGGA